MRLFFQLFCFTAVVVVAATGVAQEKEGEKPPAAKGTNAPLDFGFPRPETRPVERSLPKTSILRQGFRTPVGLRIGNSSAGRLITIQVTLAETPVVGDGKEMSAEKVAELEKKGNVISQSRYWVSLVENQRSELQFGERVQVVAGRTNLVGGRGMQETMVYENVGTKLGLVGRIDGDSILLQLELDQTRLLPASAKPEEGAGESSMRPRTATTTFNSTLTIPLGKTVVAGGREIETDKGKVQTWLLVSATAEGENRELVEEESQVKIFRLTRAKAESLASVLQGVFSGENVQIGVDDRSNSLIARGHPKTLETMYRLIMALDEAQADESKTEAKK